MLKCWIEGIGPDQILVRFTHLDPTDPAREFSLVLDVSARAYKGPSVLRVPSSRCARADVRWRRAVPTTTPFLPTLPILLDELNESRDVYAFIRHIRAAFQELTVQGR